jgi:hypothetical protein
MQMNEAVSTEIDTASMSDGKGLPSIAIGPHHYRQGLSSS